ncbi:MAG TPA: hypothetical protein VGG68_00660 [Caulobacteraceae bacterium]|jgi:hypothetical protein
MLLIANRPFTYLGQRLQPGDEFEARARDARAFLSVKIAKGLPPKPPPPTNEASAAPPQRPIPGKPAHYQTRRLKASEDD